MIKSFTFCSLLVLLFNQFYSVAVNAGIQDYRYQKAFKVQRLSLSEGLSQSVVMDVIQDSDGYIWLATEDGLNRFDSYQFKIYRHDHRNQKSLHENWIISLVEEPGYGIWVGTVAGLSFFNPQDESFIDYSSIYEDLKTNINTLLYANNAIVWVGTDNGLYFWDRSKNKVVTFVSSTGLEINEEVNSISESKEYIYVATSACIFQIHKITKKTINLCDLQNLEFLHKLYLTAIKIQSDFLWIGTSKGLYRYSLKSNQVASFLNDSKKIGSISANFIQDFVIDKNQGLWIATTKGLNFYNKNEDIFEHYSQQNIAEDGLSSNDVVSLYVDDQDLIWLGTYGGGVNILDPNQHQFEHLLNKTDVANIGENNTIHGIQKDRYETLWLASYGGGLINYDLLSGKITRPLNDANIDYDEYVYALLIDRSDRLWVGSLTELKILDVRNKIEIETQFWIDGTLVSELDSIIRIHEDHQGNIWLGSENGLFKVTEMEFENNRLKIELIDLSHKLPNSFTNYSSSISSIIDDQDGNFWMGGHAGLIYYQTEKDEWSHYRYDKNNAQSLSNDNVQVIFEDSQGFLWVGTADGLNRVKRSTIEKDIFYFERITTYQGLPNNAIYGILEDQSQQLWISTTLGLARYTHNAINMDAYRSIDGLSSDEFNTGAYFSDNDGRLYFGSINGITIVNNVAKRSKSKKKSLMFSDVKVGDRMIDIYRLNHSEQPTITQRSNEAAIEISMVDINFDKLGTQRYRYRLTDLDDNWNYTGLGRSRNIFIAGLKEGEYKLEIESQLAGRQWTKQVKRLNINVSTSFWNSSQAYYLIASFILILFLFSLFFVARVYNNRVRKLSKKMNIELLRLRESRADNDALKSELHSKESEVISLNEKIEINQQQIGVEKYRDVVTGFYRVNYLNELKDDELIEQNSFAASTGFTGYKSLAVLELNDYAKLQRDYGPIAATELAAKVAILLRQKTNASAQIYSIRNGVFLIMSCQINTYDFRDSMSNLRQHIVRSEFDIANGMSASSYVTLMVMDVESLAIANRSDLISTTKLIINAHQFCVTNDKEHSNLLKININTNLLMQDYSLTSVENLFQRGELQVSRL